MAQQQRDPYEIVTSLIDKYNQDPTQFKIEQVQELKSAADELGINFKPQEDLGRMAKNVAFGLADTATFGFLPDEFMGYQIKPDQLTTADKTAEGVGGLLGFAVPMGVGGKVAKMGMGALEKVAGGESLGLAEKLLGKFKGVASAEAKIGGLAENVAARGGVYGPLQKAGALRAQTFEKLAAEQYAKQAAAATTATRAQRAGAAMYNATSKTLDAIAPYAAKGAKFLTSPGVAPIAERAMQFGVAQGLSNLGNDIGNGDLTAPIARTFGGAIGGGAAGVVGKFSPMLNQYVGLSNKVGAEKATKIIAAAIFANMTAPEKEQYPKEFLEHFVKYAALGAFAK